MSHTQYPCEREDSVKTEAEMAAMQPQPRNTKGGLQCQMLARIDLLPQPSEEYSPADALTSAPGSRTETKISVVISTHVVAFCYGSHKRHILVPGRGAAVVNSQKCESMEVGEGQRLGELRAVCP